MVVEFGTRYFLSHRIRDILQAEDARSAGPAIPVHFFVVSGPALGQEPTLDNWRASSVGVRLVVPVGPRFLDRELDENLFISCDQNQCASKQLTVVVVSCFVFGPTCRPRHSSVVDAKAAEAPTAV